MPRLAYDTRPLTVDKITTMATRLGIRLPDELTSLQKLSDSVKVQPVPQLIAEYDATPEDLNALVVSHSAAIAARAHQQTTVAEIQTQLAAKAFIVAVKALEDMFPAVQAMMTDAVKVIANVSTKIPPGSPVAAITGETAQAFVALEPAERTVASVEAYVELMNALTLYPCRAPLAYVFVRDAQEANNMSSATAPAHPGEVNTSRVAFLLAAGYAVQLLDSAAALENLTRSTTLATYDDGAATVVATS